MIRTEEKVLDKMIQEFEEAEILDAIKMCREKLANTIKEETIKRRMPPDTKYDFQCVFSSTGCVESFKTGEQLISHVKDCPFGSFRYCNETSCKSSDAARISGSINEFVRHAITCHNLTVLDKTDSIQGGINLTLRTTLQSSKRIKLLGSVIFKTGDQKHRLLLALVIEDVRVMVVPLLYSENDKPINDLLEFRCILKKMDDGKPILPIAYPAYDLNNPNPSVTLYAFTSAKQFLTACEKLDDNLIYILPPYPNEQVKLEIRMKWRGHIVSESCPFPPVRVATGWYDLDLHPDVRLNVQVSQKLSDEQDPSYESKVIVPQMKGQSNFIVKDVNTGAVTEAFMTGVVDYIVKLEPCLKENQPKPVSAIIVYPNIILLMKKQAEWKKRVMRKLNVQVVSFHAKSTHLINHLMCHGTDILLITPDIWQYVLSYASDKNKKLMDLVIGQQLRFVVIHHLQMVMQPEIQQNLKDCFAILRKNVPDSVMMIADTCGKTNELLKKASFIFNESVGYNQICIGIDSNQVVRQMDIYTESCLKQTSKIMKLADLINRTDMRWLVLFDPSAHNDDFFKPLFNNVPAQKITMIRSEKEVLENFNAWDPFLLRSNAVMIGPTFILDFEEAKNCDGVVIFDSPLNDADLIRIYAILNHKDGQLKPCLSFAVASKKK